MNKNIKLVIALVIIFFTMALAIVSSYHMIEPTEYQREHTLAEQIQAHEIHNEQCKDVRNNPNAYMPEMIEKCR